MLCEFEGKYSINDDKSFISIEKTQQLLSKSYWASDRSIETVRKTIENSDCFGVYYDKEQIGFARVISDHATVYYLCDVIIDEQHRGKGLGKKLIKYIVEKDEYKGLKGMLVTGNAHGLYRQFGFETVDGTFMRKA